MNVLFVREKEGNTTNDVLCRILSYLEQYVKANGAMPDCVKLSKKDLKRIIDYDKTIINENREILGMKVITYREDKNGFKRNFKQNGFSKR